MPVKPLSSKAQAVLGLRLTLILLELAAVQRQVFGDKQVVGHQPEALGRTIEDKRKDDTRGNGAGKQLDLVAQRREGKSGKQDHARQHTCDQRGEGIAKDHRAEEETLLSLKQQIAARTAVAHADQPTKDA